MLIWSSGGARRWKLASVCEMLLGNSAMNDPLASRSGVTLCVVVQGGSVSSSGLQREISGWLCSFKRWRRC